VTRYGYFLSSEEYDPAELVRQARLAEQAGFEALWISDHFHPWLDEQGQSSFVWSVIGAISQASSLPITTAVTCPIMRIHPALVAQAAATSGLLTQGRFTLGLGSGEALNEHISAPCGPDPGVHHAALRQFTDAGFDEVYIGQVGGAPEAFFEFFAEQVLPRARGN
jgi:alkanesulfonate monooxygenase SsuD/methylene tetrahydromethanopterin reductase-like flavin-dependent oxidoreductase (luciferase family)